MPRATTAFHNRIAILFDFDKTLAPSSFDTLLNSVGLDARPFRDEYIKPLSDEGWDDTLARAHALIRYSRENDLTLTREAVEEAGRNIELYDGVDAMFGRVRDAATAIMPDIEVEFYLLTCGFVGMHRAHPVAEHFDDMWGSEFHYDEDGRVDALKLMITFPEKVRYILQLAKGLGTEGPNAPSDVYREMSDEKWHVPLSQMIYVGDGGSDMPAFDLMNDRGGIGIGVFSAEEVEDWAGYDEMHADRRVENLAPADFSEGSELLESIIDGAESMATLIRLRKRGQGE